MTKLTAEAYAIIEGRHSDPFHYLGLHSEGDRTVVRAFLPEASNVEAIGEHGEAAALARIHDAGLFSGALPNGSKRYQLRARFGDTVVDLDDPYRFPPVLTDFDLYLLGDRYRVMTSCATSMLRSTSAASLGPEPRTFQLTSKSLPVSTLKTRWDTYSLRAGASNSPLKPAPSLRMRRSIEVLLYRTEAEVGGSGAGAPPELQAAEVSLAS